jgi:hypothetical protein
MIVKFVEEQESIKLERKFLKEGHEVQALLTDILEK